MIKKRQEYVNFRCIHCTVCRMVYRPFTLIMFKIQTERHEILFGIQRSNSSGSLIIQLQDIMVYDKLKIEAVLFK